MARSLHCLGFALTTALLLAGCSFSTEGKGQGDSPSGPETDGGSSSSDQPGQSPPGSDSGAPSGSLSFVPANVPADASLAASGDWIFNTDTCGHTQVTIDTAKGTVTCNGQAKGAFTFKAITQTDTSQGTLTAGLFVTRRLVIEPSMVVNVVGNRPLVIVALETATIQGTLRASADKELANGGGFGGVASHLRGAGPGGGQGMSAMVGAGGGAFCGAGGGASTGGRPYGNATNSPLVGGASGGGGYDESGAGGGAIQIVAGTSLEVSGGGAIEASGGGADWYSAGGGAGGAILLEAPAVSVFGALAANGGGGSEGGLNNTGANGSASADPAKGGPASSTEGAGGDGSAGAAIDGQTGSQPGATQRQGGGGGGAGRIRINSKSGSATVGATAVISPALTTPCATQGPTATH